MADNLPTMCGAHLSDMEVATRVRMLMRDDLDHEAVCVMARDRIRHLSAENRHLREALGFAASVIKSGEPWTVTCERVIGAALKLARGEG